MFLVVFEVRKFVKVLLNTLRSDTMDTGTGICQGWHQHPLVPSINCLIYCTHPFSHWKQVKLLINLMELLEKYHRSSTILTLPSIIRNMISKNQTLLNLIMPQFCRLFIRFLYMFPKLVHYIYSHCIKTCSILFIFN